MNRIRQWGMLVGAAAVLHSGTALAQGSVEQRAAAFRSGQEETRAEQAQHPAALPPKVKQGAEKAQPRQAPGHQGGAHQAAEGVGAEEALERLLQGNRRYLGGKSRHPHHSPRRRAEVALGQQPFAVIVSCSDSRVPPELLFDQGLGDLFVVRSAGHVVDDVALGSIEYAVEHLGVKLIVVLGHERCGAVGAAVQGGEAPAHVASLVQAIRPAVERVRGKHGDLLCNSVKSNVKLVAEKIREAGPIISEAVEDGMLAVVGGYYDLESGAVSLTYKPRL